MNSSAPLSPSDVLRLLSPATLAAAEAELDRRREVAAAAAARASLSEFVRQAWSVVRPGDPLRWGWHIEAICQHLEAVHRGEIRKLLITICPGSAKSLLVEVFWPAWMWASDPTRQLVCLASDGDLALRDANRQRDLVKSTWYQRAFSGPDGWTFSPSQDAKGYFENTAKGFRYSAGVNGSVTGWRGHGVIMDDLLQAKDVHSEPAKRTAVHALENVIPSRVNDPAAGFFVMVQQRLCVGDPADWALSQGDYEHLNLPTEFDPERRSVTYHLVGGERVAFWRDPREEAGELLFPALFTPAVVEQAKKNPEMYAAQHQQDPIPPGGGMFKIADWRFWKPDGTRTDDDERLIATRPRGCYEGPANPLPRKWDKLILSVDATFKKTKAGSFVAIHVWGAAGRRRCLLDRTHARMDFDETERAVLAMLRKWPGIREKVIEDKANGSGLITRLRNVHHVGGIVEGETGDQSKEQRANAELPWQRAGDVELPDGAPWLAEYIAEHAAFPLGAHDDDVDAQSQALEHLEAEESTAAKWVRGYQR